MAQQKTDPTLQRQVTMDGNTGPVSAVFRLRPHAASDLALPPNETETTTRIVLDRVTGSVGVPPDQFHVFPTFGSFSVSAQPVFLRRLLEQPEILSAIANVQDGDFVIRPVPPTKRARKPTRPKKASR